MSVIATTLVTAEELAERYAGRRCELVRGEVIETPPAGGEHGGITMDVGTILNVFVKAQSLGRVYGAETGFVIERDPDTVRAPDVAFIRKARMAGADVRGFIPVVPDLVAEVVSPGDTWSEVDDKVQQWLGAGVVSAWVIDPAKKLVSIFRSGAPVERFGIKDEVRDEAVLPGLVVKVTEIFSAAV